MSYYDFSNQGSVPQYQTPQFQVPQPQTTVQRPVPINDTKFTWIYGGTKSAKAYPQAPNMTGYYRDNEEPYLFEKTTDNYGKVISFKKYKLTEEPDEDTIVGGIPTGNFVTTDDFNKFQTDINSSIQNLVSSITTLSSKLDEKPKYNNYRGNKGRVDNE